MAVDTTATVERKVAALLCHKSQIRDPDGVTERVSTGPAATAERPACPRASAELFRVTRIP